MKKLNNKGLTIIEVILCFVLVSIITASLYTVISTFNEKRIQEKYKEEIYAYKNLLQKEIEDDFIKIGVTSATVNKTGPTNGNVTYTLTCVLKDGTKRRLIVSRTLNTTDYRDAVPASETANVNDAFSIRYGTVKQTVSGLNIVESDEDVMNYPLPDFGNSVESNGKTSKMLSINRVTIDVDENRVLRIFIGLFHPELGIRYSINVVTPINYNSVSDKSNSLNLY